MIEGQALGRYLIGEKLGEGAMGTVYKATVQADSRSVLHGLEVGETVAVKVIHPHILASSGVFKRFLREADVGKRARHPNIVSTFEADAIAINDRVVHYLVMEYVAGQTLHSLLAEMKRLPESLCRHIALEITRGLVEIHAMGIVHRDLKPENVLITEDHVVKLMDLGVAHMTDVNTILSQPGVFIGTVAYAAPEQFRDAGSPLDGRADLYALGAMLYELASGKNPFRDDDLLVAMERQLNLDPKPLHLVCPDVSQFLSEFVRALLEKQPGLRLPDSGMAQEVLERAEESDWWESRKPLVVSRPPAPPAPRDGPFDVGLIGRKAELETLETALQNALDASGKVIILEGEEGIGKSRLLSEFAYRCRAITPNAQVLQGAFPPAGAATATSGFGRALLSFFAGGNLEQVLARHLGASAAMAPALASVLMERPNPSPSDSLSREAIPAALSQVLQSLADEHPTILLLDDLHLAPADAQRIVAGLAVGLEHRRILLVVGVKWGHAEEWISELDRLPFVTRLRLRRLGTEASVELLRSAFGSEVLARDLQHLVGTRAGGNPLFTLEILRSLVDRRVLAKDAAGRWSMHRPTSTLKIPATIREVLDSTIARLPEEERELLQFAACCGVTFDPKVLAEIFEVPRIPLLKRLARLEHKQHLIQSEGMRFRFHSHQLRELMYESLPEALRREYHASIADAMVRLCAEEATPVEGAIAVSICRHSLAGGVRGHALAHLESALRHEEEIHDHGGATTLATMALDMPSLLTGPKRLEMLLRIASRLDYLGRLHEEGVFLGEANELADSLKDAAARARAKRALGAYRIRASDYSGASVVLEAARNLAQEAGDTVTEAGATSNLGVALTHLGRFQEALDLQRAALRIHRELGDDRGVVRVLTQLEFVLGRLGLYKDAWQHYGEAISIADEIGYERGSIRATVHFAFALSRHGNQQSARRHLEDALERARALGYRRGEADALHGLGVVWDELDARETSLQQFEEAVTLRRLIEDPRGVAVSLIGVGRLLASLGRPEMARGHLEEAETLARVNDLAAPMALTAIHLASLPDGDIGRAEEALGRLEHRLGYGVRMTAHALLWMQTDAPRHLKAARDLLAKLVLNAPDHLRSSMVEHVRIHAAILAAWSRANAREAGRSPGDPT